MSETNVPDARQQAMRTFYALYIHRKDGRWHRHLMRGELPKLGDTVPAILSGEEAVVAKVARLEERGEVTVKVHADEI